MRNPSFVFSARNFYLATAGRRIVVGLAPAFPPPVIPNVARFLRPGRCCGVRRVLRAPDTLAENPSLLSVRPRPPRRHPVLVVDSYPPCTVRSAAQNIARAFRFARIARSPSYRIRRVTLRLIRPRMTSPTTRRSRWFGRGAMHACTPKFARH